MTQRASLMRQLENPALTPNQRAELRCQVARELEDKGEYEAAREALGGLWQGVGERPHVEGLEQSTAAEVLLRVGVLTGWLGSIHEIKDAQERAKNLISESARLFESQKKILESETELAFCYWREGGYDEARVILRDVLSQLKTDSELKAKAILRSAIVEWSSLYYSNALCILSDAAPLFEKINNPTIKGGYFDALAGVLVNLGASEHREDYTDRAFVEYAAASFHFEQAGHKRYLANVENNLGFLYFKVGKFTEAHKHLDYARRILTSLKDSGTVAQVDETRARVFIAQEKYSHAESVARSAVRILEKGGRQSLLAEALTTHGVALARLSYHEQARFTLYRAVEVAHVSGAVNTAGHAALAIIEELSGHLSADEMQAVYQRAYQWLLASQESHTLQRLLKAANRVLSAYGGAQGTLSKLEAGTKGTLKDVMLKYEKEILRQALRAANGSVTRAADLLGIHYQSLVYALKNRHRDLVLERSPAKPRKPYRRSIIKKPE
ncbi:MAG TPA: tetratricopeptide repeat protein [Pyrinomonadaceae bacterium]|jgi:tetratricopeptide (TPR) repeat protein